MAPPSPTSPTRTRRFTRRYWRRLFIVTVILLLAAVIGMPVVGGWLITYGLTHGPCSDDPRTPADFGHVYEDVRVPADGEHGFRAYFIPGENRATVIIPPPTSSGRGNRLHEADVLARNGYAVLIYESRRCAGMGPISLGYQEVNEVGDALAYLQSRPDVDPDRIAVFGFSSAGATSVMAGARYPALRAVIAEGGYGDFAEGAVGLGTVGDNPLETIFKWSLAVSYRVITGVDIDRLSPQDVIGQIAPRPVLLVYGSEERSLAGAYDQLAAAGDNAELWVVPGAHHGDYVYVAANEYERRLIAFLDKALFGAQTSQEALGN